MKKLVKSMFTTLIIGLSLPLGLPLTAYAAEGNIATSDRLKNGMATVNITGGSLILTSVPSFSVNATLTASARNGSFTATPSGALKVDDERGTGSGWRLTAKLGDLSTQGSDHTITGTKLKLSVTSKNALIPATTLINNSDACLLASADNGQGMGITAFDLDQSTIQLPDTTLYTGKYTGTITYQLSDGPKS